MMTNSEGDVFATAYAKLNSAQREAVDTIEGPVMVIAGPGTGKTQILTLRIANILRLTDTKPENILALTFTENGARNLKERLRTFIGSAAYRVNAFTFHSFADNLIRQYPEAYNQIIGSRPARELEKVSIIEEVLDSPDFKLLRPLGDPAYYVKSLLGQLSELKREYISPDDLALIIDNQESDLAKSPKFHEKGAHKGKVKSDWQKQEKVIRKNRELLLAYRLYEASLRSKKLYDFDDMIIETIKALEQNPDMLLDLQESYQYLLADEHQDVNGSQNKILSLLASYHNTPNIFVVGDEKQAIFRFQGASLENFLYFETAFPGTKTITLTDNYRSGQSILDLAHSLVEVAEGPLKDLRVPLNSKAKSATIELAQFQNQAIETNYVVDEVTKLIAAGVSPDEIALILRTNKEVEYFAAALRQKGIAAKPSADSDILEHPITKAVLELLAAATEPSNEAALFLAFQQPYWKLPISDIFTISAARTYANSLSAILFSPEKLSELNLTDIDAAKRISTVLTNAREAALVDSPPRVVQQLLTESGLLKQVEESAIGDSIQVIRRLYDEIESMLNQNKNLTLPGVVNEFKLMMSHNIALTAPYLITDTQSVVVMTAHKAKGLEFAHVFIPALTDSKWGKVKSKNAFKIPLTKHLKEDLVDISDDDKRLLYVALTRAKTGLHLSLALNNIEGSEQLPSRFLEELDMSQVKVIDTKKYESKFDVVQSLVSQPVNIKIPEQFLIDILRERGFSATSLNNYLTSPWDFIFRNVLRLPEIQPLHMQYGTALHNVLELATKMHTSKGKLPTVSQLSQYLNNALERLPLNTSEFARLHEQALGELTVYLEHLKNSLPVRTTEEFKLRVVFKTGIEALPEIPLTGKFDRLDFDESDQLLRVVDYKTGNPKTRNEIEGNTKNADGNYKRQLVFYALLLSLYEDDRYKTNETLLSFVRADSKGKIHEEPFTITAEEIELLKKDIVNAVQQIVSGEYINIPCDPNQSQYFELKNRLFS